jgi:outer membrane immunogenic protein
MGEARDKASEIGPPMRKIILAAALLALGSASAFAADLGASPYAKAPAMTPAWSWAGAYIGLNAGYSWGNSNTSLSKPDVFEGVPIVGTFPSLKSNGFIGGGQIGYNWQSGTSVLGAELDFSGLGVKGTKSVDPLAADLFNNFVATFSSRYEWLLTVRGKLGAVVAPNWLLYLAGGLAVTRVSDTVNLVNDVINFVNFADSKTLTGGTVGGGVEYAFAPNWSAKVEYLYARFGSTLPSYTKPIVINQFPVAKFDHSLDIVRAGVNYHF